MRRLLSILAWFVAVLQAGPALASTPGTHAIDIPKWFSESFLDLREDVREAAGEKKRLLLYFGQDGCPYCKALMKVNFGEPDIAATTRANFVAVALNLWGDREVTWIDGRKMSEKELARVLGVQYTPTLLFFDEKGAVALRLNGYQPPDRFRLALEYASLRGKRPSYTEFLAARAGSAPRADEGDLQAALGRGKPVLVIVAQASCRECEELEREGLLRAEVASLLGKFTVVRRDLAGQWARDNRIAYTPSLVFLDATGKESFRAEGYLRPFHLAAALDYVASGAYRKERSFQRYLQARADARRARGQPVDLWK